MSPVRVTCRRTVGRLLGLWSTALSAAAFMAACAALFAFNLDAAEGGRLSLAAVWTTSVSPVLPVLAALLGMGVWSDERTSGRMDVLLSSPVRERDFVLGKFLGVWTTLLALTGVFHVVTMSFLAFFAPRLLTDLPSWGFGLGFLALALQGAAWSAVSVAASAACRRAAAAASLSILFLVGVPRGGWLALMAWSSPGRTAFGEMPLDAHACDIACGLVSFATVVSYVLTAAAALFIASKLVSSSRLAGRGSFGGRFSTFLVLVLTFACLGSSVTLARRLDATLDIPVGMAGWTDFSARTKGVLSETHGEIAVTAFLPRKDARFRPVGHFLRVLAKASEAQGGARIVVRYVDPNWDLGAAERLVRAGAKPGSLVFERGRRLETVLLSDGFDERICVSTILRIAMPPSRRTVYWTSGHGESSFSSYETFGMSGIARDIARDGYRNRTLDLSAAEQIPSDCALVVVAGAKNDFSRIEAGRLDAYLRQGGRILVLLGASDSGGVAPVLSRWGIRPAEAALPSARTLSWTDVIVTDFANHAITSPLSGSQLVLEKPVSFSPSAAVETGSGDGADRIEFTPLASVGGVCVAAASERGVGAGEDLRIRPTRIVAVGDAGFVMNGALAARANANRDFFLNCVAYLAGTDAVTESGDEPGRLVSGMDRAARAKFLVGSAVVFPLAFLAAVLSFAAFGRRRG